MILRLKAAGYAALDFIRSMVRNEPARFIGWGIAGSVAVLLWVAGHLHFDLSTGQVEALYVFLSPIVAEIVRRFVYSPGSVDALVMEDANVTDPLTHDE